MPKLSLHQLDSLNAPQLNVYAGLRGKTLRKDGIFIAESEKVVRALCASTFPVLSLLTTAQQLKKIRPYLEKKLAPRTPVYLLPKEEIEKLVGFSLHQGVMAASKIPKAKSLPRLAKTWRKPHLLVALDGVKDAENLGMIVRNCLAFGVDCLIIGKGSSHPFLRRSVRVSIGTIFKLPLFFSDNLASTLKALRSSFGSRIIVADCRKASLPLSKADFDASLCLVFGSEQAGVSEAVRQAADQAVRIPIIGVDSLNVACANAAFLFAAAEKRKIFS
jgi:tRNA G18 (ribose-2'-O)-methylase SpoU